ncbi:hypothetical protein [Streptomyces sp. NPDC091027]|uniref:hypothetical protein n=1 Tax=Streptomyces sp. NPDC091027 TaxID=3365971 RepID=UPI003813FFED
MTRNRAASEPPASPAAQRITGTLHCHVTDARDGFAAREALADPLFTKLAQPSGPKDPHEPGDRTEAHNPPPE